MVTEMIRRDFDVRLLALSVGQLLCKMSLSRQRPAWLAPQQNPDAVETCKTETFPQTREEAAQSGGTLWFADEAGVRSDYHAGTTWASVGQTQVDTSTEARHTVNMISAVAPDGSLRFATYTGRFTSPQFIDFCKRAAPRRRRARLPRRGRPSPHRSKATKKFVASTNGQLRLWILPGYSPQLDPDEWAWNKTSRPPRSACRDHQPGRPTQQGGFRTPPPAGVAHLVRGFFADPPPGLHHRSIAAVLLHGIEIPPGAVRGLAAGPDARQSTAAAHGSPRGQGGRLDASTPPVDRASRRALPRRATEVLEPQRLSPSGHRCQPDRRCRRVRCPPSPICPGREPPHAAHEHRRLPLPAHPVPLRHSLARDHGRRVAAVRRNPPTAARRRAHRCRIPQPTDGSTTSRSHPAERGRAGPTDLVRRRRPARRPSRAANQHMISDHRPAPTDST